LNHQNFTKILEIIGLIIGDLILMGATEGFGKFLDSVKIAAENFGDIGLAISENALPAVGRFIEKFSELAKIFVDPLPIAIFFDTLAIAIGVVVALFDNEFMRAILAVTGAMLAFGIAIELTTKSVTFFGKAVIANALMGIDRFLSVLPGGGRILTFFRSGLTATRGALLGLQGATLAAAAPFLIVVAAIAAVIAILVIAYNKSEILRKALKDFVDGVLGALKEGWDKIKLALKDAMPFIDGVTDGFKALGDFLGKYIVPFFKEVLIVAINLVVDVIIGLIKVVKGIWDAFTSGDPVKAIKAIFDAVLGVVKGLLTNIAKAFGFKLSWAWLTDGLEDAVNFIAKGINKVSETLNKAIDGFNKINPFKDVPRIPMIAVPIKLAKGGIVPATSGGMLATIGEAGRPERVEPLDPSGLSKRDRAMIEMLAGPAGGINITINPSQGMDERELAALVSRQLAFQLRKGAA
jgi:hypothetical protein